MTGIFEYYKVPLICHLTHLIDTEEIKEKTYMQVAFDLEASTHKIINEKSKFYTALA